MARDDTQRALWIDWLASLITRRGIPPAIPSPADIAEDLAPLNAHLGCGAGAIRLRYEARCLSFSPGGAWLAVGCKSGDLWLTPVGAPPPAAPVEGPVCCFEGAPALRHLAFLSDTTLLAAAGRSLKVLCLRADGWQVEHTWPIEPVSALRVLDATTGWLVGRADAQSPGHWIVRHASDWEPTPVHPSHEATGWVHQPGKGIFAVIDRRVRQLKQSTFKRSSLGSRLELKWMPLKGESAIKRAGSTVADLIVLHSHADEDVGFAVLLDDERLLRPRANGRWHPPIPPTARPRLRPELVRFHHDPEVIWELSAGCPGLAWRRVDTQRAPPRWRLPTHEQPGQRGICQRLAVGRGGDQIPDRVAWSLSDGQVFWCRLPPRPSLEETLRQLKVPARPTFRWSSSRRWWIQERIRAGRAEEPLHPLDAADVERLGAWLAHRIKKNGADRRIHAWLVALFERAHEVDDPDRPLTRRLAQRLHPALPQDTAEAFDFRDLLHKYLAHGQTYQQKRLNLAALVEQNEQAGRTLDAALYQARLLSQGFDLITERPWDQHTSPHPARIELRSGLVLTAAAPRSKEGRIIGPPFTIQTGANGTTAVIEDLRNPEPQPLLPTQGGRPSAPTALAAYEARSLADADGRVLVWVGGADGRVEVFEGNRLTPETAINWQRMTLEQAESTRLRVNPVDSETLKADIHAPRVYAGEPVQPKSEECADGWWAVAPRAPDREPLDLRLFGHPARYIEVRGDAEQRRVELPNAGGPFRVVVRSARRAWSVIPTDLVRDEVSLAGETNPDGAGLIRAHYRDPDLRAARDGHTRFVDLRPFEVGAQVTALALSRTTPEDNPSQGPALSDEDPPHLLLAVGTASGHLIVRQLERFSRPAPDRPPVATLIAAREASPVQILHFVEVDGRRYLGCVTASGRLSLYDVTHPRAPRAARGRFGARVDHLSLGCRVLSGAFEVTGDHLKLSVCSDHPEPSQLRFDLRFSAAFPSCDTARARLQALVTADPSCRSSRRRLDQCSHGKGSRWLQLIDLSDQLVAHQSTPRAIKIETLRRFRHPPKPRFKLLWRQVGSHHDPTLEAIDEAIQLARDAAARIPGWADAARIGCAKRLLSAANVRRMCLTPAPGLIGERLAALLLEHLTDASDLVSVETLHAFNHGLAQCWFEHPPSPNSLIPSEAARALLHQIVFEVARRCSLRHRTDPLYFELTRLCGLFLCHFTDFVSLVGLELSESGLVDRDPAVAEEVVRQADLLAWALAQAPDASQETREAARAAHEAARRLDAYLNRRDMDQPSVNADPRSDAKIADDRNRLTAELKQLTTCRFPLETEQKEPFSGEPPETFQHSWYYGRVVVNLRHWLALRAQEQPAFTDWYTHAAIEAARWWLHQRTPIREPQRGQWVRLLDDWSDALRQRRDEGRQLVELLASFDRHRNHAAGERLGTALARLLFASLSGPLLPVTGAADPPPPAPTSMRQVLRAVARRAAESALLQALMEASFRLVDNARMSSALLEAALAAYPHADDPAREPKPSSIQLRDLDGLLRDLCDGHGLVPEDLHEPEADTLIPGSDASWLAMLTEALHNIQQHQTPRRLAGRSRRRDRLSCRLQRDGKVHRLDLWSNREAPWERIERAARAAACRPSAAAAGQGLRMLTTLWQHLDKTAELWLCWRPVGEDAWTGAHRLSAPVKPNTLATEQVEVCLSWRWSPT